MHLVLSKISGNFIVIVLSIVLFSLFSCNRNEYSGDIPSTFVKRVVIEEFSGEWCSSCVSGAKRFITVLENNPDRVFGVSIHSGDPLELEYPEIAPFLISQFKVDYFPFALIDRTIDETKEWGVLTDDRLSLTHNAGIKIKTIIEKDNLQIKVGFASNFDLDNALLSVYLIEDNVPESFSGAQAGGGGNYIHRYVLRELLSSKIGDPIVLKSGFEDEKIYSVKVGKYKKDDLIVVAFIHYSNAKNYEVINANGVKAGKSVDW